MKLKLVLLNGDREYDLLATTDSTTTVGDLASHLAKSNPQRSASLKVDADMTLALVDQGMLALDPRSPVADSGLQSGMRVSVTRGSEAFVDQGRPRAVLVVLTGPDAGREVHLPRGTAYIGRGKSCEVQLSDQSVSRKHAKLLVNEVIEIVDLGSANGIAVADQEVTRSRLKSGDLVRIGDTELQLRVLDASGIDTASGSGVLSDDAGSVRFSRSPRVAPLFIGREFPVPDLPERPRRQPWPVIMMAVPALMGLAMFMITRSPLSLLFVFMMPLMYVGMYWETRRSARMAYEEAMVEFREDLRLMSDQIRASLEVESSVRRAEFPSGEETLVAVRDRSGLLWTRRADLPLFLSLRMGLGTLPSRSQIKLPALGRSRAEAWLDMHESLKGLEVVHNVPIVANPAEDGSIGIAGERGVALAAARSLVMQLAALHSPAELVIASFASPSSSADWDFLKWLPHTSSTFSPIDARVLANTQPGCSALADELEDLLSGTPKSLDAGPRADLGRPTVVALVEQDAPIDRSRLVSLAEAGRRAGVFVIWIAPTQQTLPAACKTFLVLDPNALGQGGAGTSAAGYVHHGQQVEPVVVDLISLELAMAGSRMMAPVVDAGVRVNDASDLPRSVSMLALTGTELARDEQAVIERWTESRSILTGPYAPQVIAKKPGNLRALIGQSSQGKYSVDLRSDGPHALVGGTTGAGKSELLQAWILGMATAHSPQRVTFLLVDYKGGSAFRDCVKLPHTVGLVTDLSPHLVRRALASMNAELRYREHLLARFKAKDLVELERRGEVEAPPSLVIIVDEFAALVQEVPEFVDGVVNVAQRGRSLGLHLILATQRPAGVIKDNLRANTNLRMALRMADEADSDDVLGSKEAAFFDPALPGRAVSKTGPGRLMPFQTGYAGGWTSDVPPLPDMRVEELRFGPGKVWELPEEEPDANAEEKDLGPTDIQRMVTMIGRALKAADIPKPRKPWLPDMRAVYDLAALPTERRDDRLVFAVADDPDNQAQPEQTFYPDKEGNLAVYGGSGSGKSVFLRTIAVAAGYTVRGGPCRIYGLDFGNRGLSMLEVLPHVGSIIPGGDHERVTRLLTTLRATIDDRAVRYAQVNAATITDYRRITGEVEEPRIFVLIDNMTAFRQAYEVGGRFQWLDALAGLAGDGRPVGVHFIITVDQRSGMPNNLNAAIPRRIVLRMSSVEDYSALGVPEDVLTLASPPGRGLLGADEVQIAVLGGSPDVTVQSKAIAKFAEATRAAGVPKAPPIESLTESVDLGDLPPEYHGRPVLGIAGSSLEPHGYDPRGSFIICGPSGSGRTTALGALAVSLHRFSSAAAIYLCSPRKTSELSALGIFEEVALGVDAVADVARRLKNALDEGRVDRPIAILIERIDDLADSIAETPLAECVKACTDNEQFAAAEGEAGFFSSNYGLAGTLKVSRSGLALHPDGNEALTVFRASFPGLNRAELPPGRGYLVEKGKFELLQVGTIWGGEGT